MVVFDGAMGTELLRRTRNHLPCEELNLTCPELVASIHQEHLRAGARVIRTNSFQANRIALARYQLEDQTIAINEAAVRIAQRAVANAGRGRSAVIAGSIGPITGAGTDTAAEHGYSEGLYAEQAHALIEAGAEMLICETFQSSLDIAAAVAGVMSIVRKATRTIPVAVCVTPPDDSAQAADFAASIFETIVRNSGVGYFGFNCGSGPSSITETIINLGHRVDLPLLALPSAGIPTVTGESVRFPVGVEEFTATLRDLVDRELVAGIGGCCGTTPAYIASLTAAVGGRPTN